MNMRAEYEEQRRRLRGSLMRRLLVVTLGLAVVMTLLRLDRGAGVVLPASILIALFALGLRLPRMRRWGREAYVYGLAGAIILAEAWWSVTWPGAGLPPALVLLSVNGIVFYLAWSARLGWLAFGGSVLAIAVGAAVHPAEDPFYRMWAMELGLAALGLQATAWTYLRVHSQLWNEGRRQLQRLQAERVDRAKLVGAMLDNLELPLNWARLEPDDFGRQAAALRQGLDEARRLRETLSDPDAPADTPPSARRLLVPLLGVGILIALAVGLRDLLTASPRAWIALLLAAVLGLLMLYLRRRPAHWNRVAAVTLLAASAAIVAGAAATAPGRLTPGLSFAAMTVAFAALWLGRRSALAFTALMGAVTLWSALGRGAPLDRSGSTMAVNMAAIWVLLAYFLAPATQAQEEMVRELDEQGRLLNTQLRVRRRLLGTLFHDAANHVATLNALAALRASGAAEAEDNERFLRIHGRLAELVTGAREWLFSDEPFPPERLERVDVAALGAGLEELFRERFRAKELALVLDLPAGLGVRALPKLLGEAVLGNLLSNALKYSARGKTVSLRAWEHDGWACLAVQDQGRGLGPGQAAAFARRRTLQAAPGSEGEGGQGLGLSLARDYVERMGGRLELANAPGGGAEARVWLRTAP